jgi:pimeloyl-ACP methyl ester carboxylesterase
MSLWLDMLGAEIRFVETKRFGRTRIAEAGRGNAETLLFLHGIGGHLEAYAKNIVPLSDRFHVVAYDYVGHGLSEKKVMEYTPVVLGDHLGELLDALNLRRVHLSGESLGGWISGIFAGKHPDRVARLILNTSAGLPVRTEKGKAELEALRTLSQKAVGQVPTFESIQNRMKWLFHEDNHGMISDELIRTRLAFYTQPVMREVGPKVLAMIGRHDEFLTPLDKIKCETLFLWTEHNPVHDVETARIASQQVAKSKLYVMKGKSGHWPQYEAPEEFNEVTRKFLTTGSV